MVAVLARQIVLLDDVTGEPAIRLLAAEARAMAVAWQIPVSSGFACAATPLMAPYLTEYAAKVTGAPASLRPRDSLSIESSLPTGRLVQALGTEGPCTTFGGWPGGGWHALGWAVAQLESGRAERFVVGAWEANPSRMVWLYLGAEETGQGLITGWRWLPGKADLGAPGLSAVAAALEGDGPVSLEAGGVHLTVSPTCRERGDRA
ncbi:MAG: hypothetical protein K0R39_3088 [Symbiobacteriaceae bacterium]|jgi:hypothetical protein|nr:hypothetical protein [Symbiobacteriaceae bacterium]